MKRIQLLYALLIAATLSCSKKEMADVLEQDCSTVNCTFDLQWIVVKVVDRSDAPVALDRMKITRLSDGRDLTRTYPDEEWNAFRRAGSYPITGDIDDKHIPLFEHTKLRFQGFIGSREVLNADYVVTFDCCHIGLVSGEQTLTVAR